MEFLTRLTSFDGASLTFFIFLILTGTLWPALHGDPGTNRGYYVWPIVGLIILIILIFAWVRAVLI